MSAEQTRHPGVQSLLGWLEPNPNLPPPALAVSELFHALAMELETRCQSGPELTTGLRKLLEAKDCCVRATLEGQL